MAASDNDFEDIIGPGMIACGTHTKVLEKAKALGVLSDLLITSLEHNVKVILSNEVIKENESTVVNIYAFINFYNPNDKGYAYLKLINLYKNLDKIPIFIKAVNAAGGNFTELYFKERFTPN